MSHSDAIFVCTGVIVQRESGAIDRMKRQTEHFTCKNIR